MPLLVRHRGAATGYEAAVIGETPPSTDPSRAAPTRGRVLEFLRNNGLTVAAVGLFLLVWIVGQALTGLHTYNADQKTHGGSAVGLGSYLTSSHFGEATFENWESEFLQMGAYVLLTVWLFQRGSAESKALDGEQEVDEDPSRHTDDADAPWPVRRGGIALALYKRSLSLVFFALFGLAFLAHAVTGAAAYNAEQHEHGETAVSTWEFVQRAQFWFESLQNWQSEFLAVAAIVVLTIFLRQQGSPESKPVHAPNHTTGT
jgi:hypothetical protein